MSESAHDDKASSWLERFHRLFVGGAKTRQSLIQVLRIAHQNKVIDHDALEIMEGALQVAEQQVREIMVSRTRMVVIHHGDCLADILARVTESNHSRYPVVGDTIDDIRGILLAKELLPLLLDGQESFAIERFIRPATIIPESKRLNVLLREFREQRYHMAIVVDEYAQVAGLVTIEDILEEIVGDIEDETDDDDETLIRKQADDSYLVAGLTPIEEFNERFDTGFNEDVCDTVGGIVASGFGYLPRAGEVIVLEHCTFRVTQADRRQIHQVEVRFAAGNRASAPE